MMAQNVTGTWTVAMSPSGGLSGGFGGSNGGVALWLGGGQSITPRCAVESTGVR